MSAKAASTAMNAAANKIINERSSQGVFTIDHTAVFFQRLVWCLVKDTQLQTPPKTLGITRSLPWLVHEHKHRDQAEHYYKPQSILGPC